MLVKLCPRWPLLIRICKFFLRCQVTRKKARSTSLCHNLQLPSLLTIFCSWCPPSPLPSWWLMKSCSSSANRFTKDRRKQQSRPLKWARYEILYTFGKCGSKEQVICNVKVEEALSQTESNLSSIPIVPTTSSAIQNITGASCNCTCQQRGCKGTKVNTAKMEHDFYASTFAGKEWILYSLP